MAQDAKVSHVVLGIHGGTGMDKADMTPELEKPLRAALAEALQAGFKALQQTDGSSLDAVEAAIRVLEDSPLFNAGRGAVFTAEGRNELDASIMSGLDKRAGSVAGVTVVKNPISAARAVMEKSPHVMLIGRGADAFAAEKGLDIVSPVYFWTEPRWRQLQEALQKSARWKSRARGNRSAACPATSGAPWAPWPSIVGAIWLPARPPAA